ncbi:SpoVK/Ycf46/Vps4 family AAA+-type ATPase [Altererythrobacter atlanticus]|uniref:ATP-dependent zinc metalloprotease FtsH 4 n=1 Tax=Croceibacterium atlanticum TaxID=1267766 RepID=A0A0F7KWD1_9SPHN|nr:ATP-binding protein [Croceibacterium atlanticum]AKH44024.1 ATP-dependent zinc metalloprotease FtsH 4 [Croceibacterium atlanticum]MBB5732331.1 SpoVK/Ycf46/Vps4 family AAA+-type ATPase [Croceibacterium atlanticum]
MARGELMKKLLASYGRDEEFRAVAEQIIGEEEKKNNRVLARSLRKSLETGPSPRSKPRGLAPLIPFPESAGDFIELVEPSHNKQDIVLSSENVRIFLSLLREYRRGDEIRRRGLPVRSKLLFCGPPGCGKTLCAEVFAAELGLPLYIVKIDRLISSYLGETATNIRKIFEFARKQPTVLFFDEFDALARARSEDGEHSELRRVVNSLLIFIDRIQPKGFLVAATNFDQSLDSAIWRRFDEVIWFDRPDRRMAARFLRMKFKNVPLQFDPEAHLDGLDGYSYAELERICVQAIKASIIDQRKQVSEKDFLDALVDERRRRRRTARIAEA